MPKVSRLDISSLIRAVSSLDEVLVKYKQQSADAIVRDATIQRFEYTYELSHKMLKRYLEMSEPNAEEIDQMSFANLIRTASERGLLQNGWDVWVEYRSARNLTSHTYNEAKAIEVCLVIPGFLEDVKFLSNRLQERINDNDN
jgi:nucleotidyltransferase substrate binding protein (TIGR01987 family)